MRATSVVNTVIAAVSAVQVVNRVASLTWRNGQQLLSELTQRADDLDGLIGPALVG
jgi:hypothetical protein